MNSLTCLRANTMRAGVAALLLCLALHALAAEPGQPDPVVARTGAALLEELRSGGLVIYFRHADTGPAYQEQGVDLQRCETQRNLNEKGKADARYIGEQFRRLGIPVGTVLSSEFCRCKETAELAFGRFEADSLLSGVSRSADAAPQRKRAATGLKRRLAAMPAAKTNTVLVSHGYNLWDAEGFHLGTQGEAAIYRPDGRGGHALVARIMPEQWGQLAGS